ncbi:MAG: hypothetical protein ABIO70_34865 [Pseudomonadota bacterium]
MRWSRLLLLLLSAALPVASARAAARDAVARVTGCGPPALAAFVGTGRERGLLAVTLRSAVVGSDGTACAAPVLVLPEGRGRLLAKVGPSRSVDDLAVLELLPDQALPADLDTLVVADQRGFDAVAFGSRALRVDAGIDDAGHVAEPLARLESADLTGFSISWVHPLTWPWLPGAPVVGDGGQLLGLLHPPEGEAAVARGSTGGLHSLLELHYDLMAPTPPGRFGVWLARPRGAAGEAELEALRQAVARELQRAGLAPELWEVRDLGFTLDAPAGEIAAQARRLGGAVNASLVVGSTWDQGADGVRRHRAVIQQLPREPAAGERAAGADPSGAARRGEVLVLPVEARGGPRMVAAAVAALATVDIVRLHPARQPASRRLLLQARERLTDLRAEQERWRAGMSRSSPEAARWAREAAAALDRLDADLLRLLCARAGACALPGGRSPCEAAARAYTRAETSLSREESLCAWVGLRRLAAEAWLELPAVARPEAALDPLLAATAEAATAAGAEACPVERAGLSLARGRLLLARDGASEADLRAAIAAFGQAEQVFTLVGWPATWAGLQVDLGRAWLELPVADRAASLESALGALRAALPLLDAGLFPHARAEALVRLGQAQAQDPVGDPFTRRREALATYDEAMTLLKREEDLILWARIRNGQGAALQGLPWQDPPDHLRQALAAHQDALAVFTREQHPLDWARTHALLGEVVWQLPSEDPRVTFSGALVGFTQAIEVFHTQQRSVDWALAWRALGDAERANPTGDRAAHLDHAIQAYESALTVFTPEADPRRWAETWQRVGQAWRERRDGDRAANLASSVAAFERALTVFTPEGNPSAWELCQGDLFVAQAWQASLEEETRAPGGAAALQAQAEAALQEALLRRQRRLPQAGEDLFAEASDLFARAVALAPEDATLLDGQALALWYQDRYAEAAEVQARILALHPDDVWAARGLALYRLRARLAEHPDDPEAWARLGAHYEQDGDTASALEAWGHALTLQPGDGAALGHVVHLCARRMLPEQAEDAVALSLVHAPEDPAVLAAAVFWLTAGAPDPMRALPLAQRWVASAPEDPEAGAALALVELLLGRAAEAIQRVNRLLDRRPPPATLVRLHALRLVAGLAPRDVAPGLLRAYATLPAGVSVEGAWPLLTAQAQASLEPDRIAVVLPVLDLLQQPAEPAGAARLRGLLLTSTP